MNPKVDFYFTKNTQWAEELEHLRAFILAGGLTEELKWGVPCYTFQQKNVVLLHVFKEYCAMLFPKGALLRDTEGILVQQTQNTQAARQVRFTALEDVVALEATLKAYIQEAIAVEKSGQKVPPIRPENFIIPDELENQFKESAALRSAFNTLTPGRQRAYILYFLAPKQSKTREARIEKCRSNILRGKGLHE